jgi:hypothetical protein
VASRPTGVLERDNKWAGVQHQAVLALPDAVALKRNQLGTMVELAEDRVKTRVGERFAEVADDHRFDIAGLHVVQLRQVLAQGRSEV